MELSRYNDYHNIFPSLYIEWGVCWHAKKNLFINVSHFPRQNTQFHRKITFSAHWIRPAIVTAFQQPLFTRAHWPLSTTRQPVIFVRMMTTGNYRISNIGCRASSFPAVKQQSPMISGWLHLLVAAGPAREE